MAELTTKMNGLPSVSTYITGHDESTAKSILQSEGPATWQALNESLRFNVIYTTSEFPVSLNGNNDITTHKHVMASGSMGLVNPHGTVCRMVDFGPSNEPLMHRTRSLDYGIVLEGSIEMVLDSGEVRLMHRGDVAVQRGTMHAWRNPSKTEWCRMIFILQDCQKILVGGRELVEDLGVGIGTIPASGNDIKTAKPSL